MSVSVQHEFGDGSVYGWTAFTQVLAVLKLLWGATKHAPSPHFRPNRERPFRSTQSSAGVFSMKMTSYLRFGSRTTPPTERFRSPPASAHTFTPPLSPPTHPLLIFPLFQISRGSWPGSHHLCDPLKPQTCCTFYIVIFMSLCE